ncbi:MAG: acylneuraminate cytidylyltransferase family protein [Candidatus Eremiobacterota bacterium]
MVKRENIAVILARGGSKRIPEKNIIDFSGKPMIAWTIEAALKADVFDRVFVGTDMKKIADIAENYGASAPFLRKEYIDDYSNVSNATISVLKQIKTILNEDYKNVFLLMPNCPLRKSYDIIKGYNNFLNSNTSFQISCFRYGCMNPWWAAKLNDRFHPEFIFPEGLKSRSQDLPVLYCPTGAIWIANVEALIKEGTFYGKDVIFYEIDWKSAIDIDSIDDLDLATAIFNMGGRNV